MTPPMHFSLLQIQGPLWEIQHEIGTHATRHTVFIDADNISSISKQEHPNDPGVFCVLFMKSGESHSFYTPEDHHLDPLIEHWAHKYKT